MLAAIIEKAAKLKSQQAKDRPEKSKEKTPRKRSKK